MSSPKPVAATNRLLAGLPGTDRQRLLADCEQIELKFAEVLCKSGGRIRHVYFPAGGFISLLTTRRGEADIEVGMIGTEGMLGISLLLGVNISPLHAVVQGAGPALRIGVTPFRRQLEQSPALRRNLNRYLYVLGIQLAQLVACTSAHTVEARLARWLLMTRDRAHSDEFHLTHKFLGYMLGVRRVGVTNAAGSLQDRKLIDYSRGDIAILDRPGLQAVSCGCYLAAKKTYDRILPHRSRHSAVSGKTRAA